MWQSIKSEFWSARGVAVAALWALSFAGGYLLYLGGYQVWYGRPAFQTAYYEEYPMDPQDARHVMSELEASKRKKK